MPRLKDTTNPDQMYFAGNPEMVFGVNAAGEHEADYYEALKSLMPNGYLEATPLYKHYEWKAEHTAAVRSFLIEAAPFANPKLSPGFWEHSLLASLYARVLAEELNLPDLNPHEAEALNLLHDFGRLFSPDQYYRNEVLNDLFTRQNGMRAEELAKLPDNSRILGLRGQPVASSADLTAPQIVLHAADWLGKRGAEGELVTPDEILNASNASFDGYKQRGQWLSSYVGIQAIEGGKVDLGNQLFKDDLDWLRSHGIDLDQVRKAVEHEASSGPYQNWLFNVKNAQESLTPAVDELLGRPAISHVVFDAGGVLLKDSQLSFCEALAKQCRVPIDKVIAELARLDTPDIMAGVTPLTDYLTTFFKGIGAAHLSDEQQREFFLHPEIHHPISGMPEIVAALSSNPDLQVSILSDSIAAVSEPLVEKLQQLYPGIENVLVSANIGASKKDPEGGAFKILLERLGVEDPRQVLFIDDKEAYTASARGSYGMRALTFRGNPYASLSPTDRLEHELRLAGLIS